jgi:glycosyltransferase involved in cell wall biosynthesis
VGRAVAPVAPHFRPCLVLPTYNNAGTLGEVVSASLRLGFPTYVVNDGSTDGTAAVLASLAGEPGLHLLEHPVNGGKAAAMLTGFYAALADGCTHAATIDTDGQLDPLQARELLDLAAQCPRALVLGARSTKIERYPLKSKLGRGTANLLIFLECGAKVSDSQCGLRVYPLGLIRDVPVRSGRFGFETEVITRAAWAGCEIVESPVRCTYAAPGKRITHFRPLVDTLRAAGLHARLLARGLSPWPHRRWPARADDGRSLWRRFVDWMNPLPAWRTARENGEGRPLAAALGVGVFIANLPLYGLHSVLGLWAARKFRLQPMAVITGSLVATPPLGPVLIAAGIALGHLVLRGRWPALSSYDVRDGYWRLIQDVALEWTTGGVLLGVAMGAGTFVLVRGALSVLPRTPTDKA